jgi:hypothetical protein
MSAVVNTQNGRVTNEAGVAGRDNNGDGAAGTFNSSDAQGNAHGAGDVNYDKNTGIINHDGVVSINDQIYAGKDGNVYHYRPGDKDGNRRIPQPMATPRLRMLPTSIAIAWRAIVAPTWTICARTTQARLRSLTAAITTIASRGTWAASWRRSFRRWRLPQALKTLPASLAGADPAC